MMRLLAGKSREGWSDRWGRPAIRDLPSGPRIWFHAASVGEVSAALPIVSELRSRREGLVVIFTVITPGGYETASAQTGGLLDSVHYAPFDVPWAVRGTIRTMKPDALVVLETELWPNMLHLAKRFGAGALLVNGRISDRSFPRYLAARGLFKWALGYFDRILTQTHTDSERFRAIGAEQVRIETFGNTKFDEEVSRLTAEEKAGLRRELRVPLNAVVWVIGSTRVAEEERILFSVYNRVRAEIPGLILIHAPRHVDRAAEVAGLMRDAGLQPTLRTQMDSGSQETNCLVLDTFGELARVYGIADVAFIGNSLIQPGGGQNLLQPLAHGVPAVYGPYMQNFRDLVSMASDAGVGFRVKDEDDLVNTLRKILIDGREDSSVDALAEKARLLVDSNRGAAARYAEAILEVSRAKHGSG